MSHPPCQRHRTRGAIAMEFALTLPLFLLLTWGLLNFASVFYTQMALTRAAHDAARALLMTPPVGTDAAVAARSVVLRSLASTPIAPPGFNSTATARMGWLDTHLTEGVTVQSESCGDRTCQTVSITFPYGDNVRLLPSMTLPLLGEVDFLPQQLTASAVITR